MCQRSEMRVSRPARSVLPPGAKPSWRDARATSPKWRRDAPDATAVPDLQCRGRAVSMTIADPTATLAAVTRTRRILESRNVMLERVARGAPLFDILTMLTRTSDEILEDVICTVLILDPKTGRLHHGAS